MPLYIDAKFRKGREVRNMESKKLYRSNTNRWLCGVCGGLGEYLGIDPTIIRLLWVLLACTTTGIIVYIIAAIIIPHQEF